MGRLLFVVIVAALVAVIPTLVTAADWPAYAADASRSGYTAEALPGAMRLTWTFRSAHAPAPAWPRSKRMTFDRAFQPVCAKGAVFFGSSADGKVHALDLRTGRTKWEFFTGGPVRFAPAVWRDTLFVASDDGYLYALSVADGSLQWKFRAAPAADLVLGNMRVISKWPVRGGLAVRDDTVYFGAGIWPSEGVYLYAIDAGTGKVKWKNADSGSLVMKQPHGASATSGVSAQGYLAVSDERVFVASGRAVPACFDRNTGRFEYFELNSNGKHGGGATVALADAFLSGGMLFDAKNGRRIEGFAGQDSLPAIASSPDGVVVAGQGTLVGSKFTDKTRKDRRGGQTTYRGLARQWAASIGMPAASVIVAGGEAVCGGPGRVVVVDMAAAKIVQDFSGLEGTVCGLAYSDGNLIASTSAGRIYCFSARKPTGTGVIAGADRPSPTGGVHAVAAAKEIVAKTGVRVGYCVDLGCGDGALAVELARQTELYIIAIEPDPALFAKTRAMLDRAGLWGERVIVLNRDPAATGLPDYIATVVVSGRSMLDAAAATMPFAEARRIQRPYGGVVCTGAIGKVRAAVRGPLAGAGVWTHQYADAGNSLCSTDTLAKGPLTMAWFRDIDIELPNRHRRGPSPLFDAGRLFCAGRQEVLAVDAYNGRELWRFAVKDLLSLLTGYGVTTTGSVFCLGDGKLFVRKAGKCYCLDVATGKLLRTFVVPDASDSAWGYLAYSDGRLYGSEADTAYVLPDRRGGSPDHLTESRTVFAMDPKTGAVLWQYESSDSIRHNAIAIDDRSVYLIDRQRFRPDLRADSYRAEKGALTPPTGTLVALDKATGEVRWRNTENIFGTTLSVSDAHDTLVMAYQYTFLKLPSERRDRMAAFNSLTGRIRWDKRLRNRRSRPLINGKRLYRDGEAWDLLTGAMTSFKFDRTYGCGHLSGSRNLLLFRSGTVGYYDLTDPAKGVQNYGGIRSGCFVNIIAVGGIVLAPDTVEHCQCSYLNKAWIALQPRRDIGRD